MIPIGANIGPPQPVMSGDSFWLPIQANVRGTGQTPMQFQVGDTLTAAVYQHRVPTPIFQPTVSWLTTNQKTLAPQTGYDQGQVAVDATAAQGAMLQPTVNYSLVVHWQSSIDPTQEQDIAVILLTVGSPY